MNSLELAILDDALGVPRGAKVNKGRTELVSTNGIVQQTNNLLRLGGVRRVDAARPWAVDLKQLAVGIGEFAQLLLRQALLPDSR